MNVPKDKVSAGRSQPAANALSGLRKYSVPFSPSADSHPAVAVQRTLQDMADKGLQSAHASAIQAMANSKAVPQVRQAVTQCTAPVQRTIEYMGKDYPNTWQRLFPKHKKGTPRTEPGEQARLMQNLAEQIREKAVNGSAKVPADKFRALWNKIAKNANHTFDIQTQQEELVAAIAASAQRSLKAKRQSEVRSGATRTLIGRFVEGDSPYRFKPNARNPTLEHSDMSVVPFNDNMTGPEQLGRHISTMMLSQHPLGQEVQASLQRDGGGLHLSSNLNAANTKIGEELKQAEDLKKMAGRLLGRKGVETMSHGDAMANREVRHMLKLYDRIPQHLSPDAAVSVPSAVPKGHDGRHAEIRIEQSDNWSVATHHTPTGTKYPCMGCYLYFSGRRIPLGPTHGPMWVSKAALSTHLESALAGTDGLGTLDKQSLEEVGQSLFTQQQALPAGVHMGKGRTRKGAATTSHDADSDSDIDEKEYTRLQERIAARNGGRPASPPWRFEPAPAPKDRGDSKEERTAPPSR